MSEEEIIHAMMEREEEENWWKELRAGEEFRPRALAAKVAASGGGAPQPSLDLGREDF